MNLLVVADIHLNNYRRFNYKSEDRLSQFDSLSSRLIEIATENNCKILLLLGDTVDKPTNNPKVSYHLAKFLNKLSKNFDKIFYILGQHDLDLKTGTHNPEDSIINALTYDNEKFIYANKTIQNIGGCTIAFMDWYPSQDLSWIESKVDVFAGHVTVSDLFGQEIDNSKFEIGLVGDIHKHGRKDNLIMVGNPIQKDMSSQQVGTVGIFDTETRKYTNVLVDPDHSRFLQIYYTSNQEEEGWVNDKLFKLYRPESVKQVTKGKLTTEDVPINEIILKHVIENGLEHIHNKIITKCKSTDIIDFNFKLSSLEIENFKSIEYYKYDFKNNVQISGHNGSGKSNFIVALYKGLVGDPGLMNSIRKGASKLKIIVTLEYQNSIYVIERGSNPSFKVDGEIQKFNNKRELDAGILDRLPFLKYADSYYFNSWNSEILNSLNNQRRVELLTKYNRLDVLDSYFNQAVIEIEELNTKLREAKEERTRLETSKTEKEAQKSLLENRVNELRKLITIPFDECTKTIENYEKLVELKGKIKSFNETISKSEEYIKKHKDITNVNNESRRDSLLNEITRIDKRLLQISIDKPKIEELRKTLSKTNIEIKELEKKIFEAQNIEEKEVFCDTCGAKITSENKDKLLETLSSQLSTKKHEYKTILDSGTRISNNYETKIEKVEKSLTDRKSRINKIIKTLDDRISEVNSIIKLVEFHSKEITKSTEGLALLGNAPEESLDESFDLQLYQDNLSNHKLIAELESQINQIDLDKIIKEIDEKINEISLLEIEQKDHISYRDLTSNKGDIYREILKSIASRLSNNQFKFSVVSERKTGAEFFDVSVQYNSDGVFFPYGECSSGQKTMCDLYFIINTINKGGILVFDEFFRFLDDENLEEAVNMLTHADVNQIIVSSHNPNFSLHNSEKLEFKMIEKKTFINNT